MKFASSIAFVTSAYGPGQLPPPGLPEIAFVGRSNVGKSSLINCLTARKKLALVSARPGKTRSINFFLIDETFYLVDLPGYGFAQVAQELRKSWQRLIESYLEGRPTLCSVTVIIDLRHEASPLDLEVVGWLRSRGIPLLLVYTKADKLPRSRQQSQARLLDRAFAANAEERVIFSAKTGDGRELLIGRLQAMLAEEAGNRELPV
ncbi:MAG: YihA family ribosome biogenesis GTP-binding protein [Desulfobacteraceae bacterium]|nr:MAG: YihA family ribosome biogenesis GTP-binding protein [Desulfobacteraceae bacterium]